MIDNNCGVCGVEFVDGDIVICISEREIGIHYMDRNSSHIYSNACINNPVYALLINMKNLILTGYHQGRFYPFRQDQENLLHDTEVNKSETGRKFIRIEDLVCRIDGKRVINLKEKD